MIECTFMPHSFLISTNSRVDKQVVNIVSGWKRFIFMSTGLLLTRLGEFKNLSEFKCAQRNRSRENLVLCFLIHEVQNYVS